MFVTNFRAFTSTTKHRNSQFCGKDVMNRPGPVIQRMTRFFILSLFLLIVCPRPAPAQVNVRLVTDEAEAVLAILARQKANQAVTASDWQRVFQSEGYTRLKKRETSMQRP